MADLTISDIAEKMKDIDFAMLSSKTDDGQIASRPMSNNREVSYDGDSWFFTYDGTRTVRDLSKDPNVELSFSERKSLLGKPGIFISVQGKAELLRDKMQFKAHWASDLERWFPQGIDTPGIVLIKVVASRLHYWDGEEDGEILT